MEDAVLVKIHLLDEYLELMESFVGMPEFEICYREYLAMENDESLISKTYDVMKKYLKVISPSLSVSFKLTKYDNEKYAEQLDVLLDINNFAEELVSQCVEKYVPYSLQREFDSIYEHIKFELGQVLWKRDFDASKISSFIYEAGLFKMIIVRLCKEFNKMKKTNPTYHSYVYESSLSCRC